MFYSDYCVHCEIWCRKLEHSGIFNGEVKPQQKIQMIQSVHKIL